MAVFNQFRTVVLDSAIVAARPVGQFVILGAGFDGRAYRLDSLGGAVVFEVDHPGTRDVKRRRASGLTPLARELRYVGMDFSRDDLVERLSAAGHDPARPTFWLLEGVTMYLDPADVALTMSRAASVSAPGSRIALTYFDRTWLNLVERFGVALWAVLIGEPLRSRFTAAELDALASSAGWRKLTDTGIQDWKREHAPSVVLNRREVGIQWDERIWVGRRPNGKGACWPLVRGPA
jgi:methyltransferase (TIGR00027 family)